MAVVRRLLLAQRGVVATLAAAMTSLDTIHLHRAGLVTRLLGLLTTLAIVVATSATAQVSSEIALPPNGDNQKAEVSQWIGLVKVRISYHSPRVHLRGK